MNRTELNKLFKWTPGWKMSIRDWLLALERSNHSGANNLFFSMKHAVGTGRLPNWTTLDHSKFFTDKNGKIMSNTAVRAAIVTAIISQSENTTAAGTKALQAAFGIRVV